MSNKKPTTNAYILLFIYYISLFTILIKTYIETNSRFHLKVGSSHLLHNQLIDHQLYDTTQSTNAL